MSNLVFANYGTNGDQIYDPNLAKRARLVAVNGVLVVGDSLLGQIFNPLPSTAWVDNGDGTGTLYLTNDIYSSQVHLGVGDDIQVYACPLVKLNQISTPILKIDPANKAITYSITGPYTTTVGTKAVVVQTTSLQNSQSNVFQGWSRKAGGNLDIVANCTIPQGNIEDIIKVFLVRAVRCKFGVGQFGINNIYGTGDTIDKVCAKAKILIDMAMAMCDIYVHLTPPPVQSTYSSWDSNKVKVQAQYEKWVAWYVGQKGGRVVVTGKSQTGGVTYRNQQSATYDPTLVPLMTDVDKLHMNMLSSQAVSNDLYAVTKNDIVDYLPWPSSIMDTPANNAMYVNDSILFTGTTGTLNGGANANVPTNVAIVTTASTCTPSIVPRVLATDGDAVGNNLVLNITNTTGDGNVAINFTTIPGRFQAKDFIFGALKLMSATGLTGITGINLRFDGYSIQLINGTTYNPRTILDSSSGFVSTVSYNEDMVKGNNPHGLVVRTPMFQLRDPAVTGNNETLSTTTFSMSIKTNGNVNAQFVIAHATMFRFPAS